jgi:hypothetical protein
MIDPYERPTLAPDEPGQVTAPSQTLLPDVQRFVLNEVMLYTWRHAPEGEAEGIYRLVVPDGFDHDFASVPRPLWALISPLDLGIASIVHDWLYHRQGVVETLRWNEAAAAWEGLDVPWSRYDSDRLFARIMREQGVVRWRRRFAFVAVHYFGKERWRDIR